GENPRRVARVLRSNEQSERGLCQKCVEPTRAPESTTKQRRRGRTAGRDSGGGGRSAVDPESAGGGAGRVDLSVECNQTTPCVVCEGFPTRLCPLLSFHEVQIRSRDSVAELAPQTFEARGGVGDRLWARRQSHHLEHPLGPPDGEGGVGRRPGYGASGLTGLGKDHR